MTKRKVDDLSDTKLNIRMAGGKNRHSGIATGKPKMELRARVHQEVTSSLTVEEQVEAIALAIKSNFGVAVVAVQRRKVFNPYQKMTPKESAQILKKAGILTGSGKLSASYK
jgi:hypothetical protein